VRGEEEGMTKLMEKITYGGNGDALQPDMGSDSLDGIV
jgi:hypothetical protein